MKRKSVSYCRALQIVAALESPAEFLFSVRGPYARGAHIAKQHFAMLKRRRAVRLLSSLFGRTSAQVVKDLCRAAAKQ